LWLLCLGFRLKRRRCGRLRSGAPPLPDILHDRLSFQFGQHAQFVLQHRSAGLILLQCGGMPALARVELHQGAVRRFTQRVEGEQPQGMADTRLAVPRFKRVVEQPPKRAQRQFAQMLALDLKPVLERG
jgi:hypothetical protein